MARTIQHVLDEGLAHHRAGNYVAAIAAYDLILLSQPYHIASLVNKGVALRQIGRQSDSVRFYRRALALRQSPDCYTNLGNSLRELGFFEEAQLAHRHAMVQQPDQPSFVYNMALLCRDRGDAQPAVTLFARAMYLDPGNPEYRWNHALSLLSAQDYASGFPAYECRADLPRSKRRKLALPLWDGEPLGGKSIFLQDEQGFGDVLQFVRFIPEVKRRGAGKIILECQPELMRLLAVMPELDAVVPRATTISTYDCYAPLLSLPALFGVRFEDLPAAPVPYLCAPKSSAIISNDRRPRIGLVWAGKVTPRDRSIPLPLLLPLLKNPQWSVYSLQLGPRAQDLKTYHSHHFVTDMGPHLNDFFDTAALLAQLDLLVTVDTAVAHLAGAMGIRTFLLLRAVSEWRWLDGRSDTPWYPTMTLFRQDRFGSWEGALRGVALALGQIHKKHHNKCVEFNL